MLYEREKDKSSLTPVGMIDRNITIIIISMAVTLFLGVVIFPYILPALTVHLSPATSPPFPAFNETGLFKQLNKQELALEKNMSEHPCTGGGINPRPGVLCPEDNNMTKLFHTANNTV